MSTTTVFDAPTEASTDHFASVPHDQLSVLEKLQQTNPDAEIWWDSSPLDFSRWRSNLLASAPGEDSAQRWAGQLERFLDLGAPAQSLVRGVTTNPSLIARSIFDDPEPWAAEVRRLAVLQRSPNAEQLFWTVYQEAARRAANAVLPIWEASKAKYGWVSVQLDPRWTFDADRMLTQALQLASLTPNVMVKVPGTPQGYEVIRELVGLGISINNTLTYTVPQFTQCIQAVEAGLDDAVRRGIETDRWRAVITHMIGRYGSQGDLVDEAQRRAVSLSSTDVRWAELEVLRRAHQIIQDNRHPVKMLLSSLEVDPRTGQDPLSMHLQHTAGMDVAYTCKPDFIAQLMKREHEFGTFDPNPDGTPVPGEVLNRLEQLPYFRKAVDPEGMTPSEFCSHGAFVSTYAEVNRNTRSLLDFISHQIDSVPSTIRTPALLA